MSSKGNLPAISISLTSEFLSQPFNLTHPKINSLYGVTATELGALLYAYIFTELGLKLLIVSLRCLYDKTTYVAISPSFIFL